MANLKDFMISKNRVKLMQLFFEKPNELYYVREITRAIKEEINAVRRELDKMLDYGLLKSEQRGNRMYYYLNKRYPFYSELQQMIAKTTGLGAKIIKNRRKLGTVDFVMFSGKFVEALLPQHGEVDVLVIGDIVLPELQELIKEHQKKIDREINYAVFSLEEFVFRKTRRDPFIMDILYGSRVMVIGSDIEFCERKTPGI